MTKPYLFNDVFIQFFNYFATPGLIKSSVVGNPQYSFLTDETRFNFEQSKDGNEPFTSTSKFNIFHYPTYKLKKSAFWSRYQNCSPAGVDNFWKMQLPFLLKLRGLKVDIARNDLGLIESLGKEKLDKINVDAYLLLNTLGWSVRMELCVSFELTPQELSKLIKIITSSEFSRYNIKPFTINGHTYDIDGVFNYFHSALTEDGFTPAEDATYSTKLHTVLSVPGVLGEPTPVYQFKHLFIKRFIEILFPEHGEIFYTLENGIKRPNVPNKTVTLFGKDKSNLSVTDFDSGTFIFMQNVLAGLNSKTINNINNRTRIKTKNKTKINTITEAKAKDKVICYSKNVCDLTYVNIQWIKMNEIYGNDFTKPPLYIQDLVENGKGSMKKLPCYLKNETCLNILKNYNAKWKNADS